MIDRLDRSIDPWKDSVIDARRKSQLRVLTTSSPTIAKLIALADDVIDWAVRCTAYVG
jgi:hypothetical protein